VISETTSLLGDLSTVQWITTLLSWTAAIVAPALALIVVTMIPALRRVFGLFERVFLVTTNIWFALAALILIVGATH